MKKRSPINALWWTMGLCWICLAFLTQESGYEYRSPPAMDDGWSTSSLAEVGMDEGYLVSLMNRIERTESHLIHGLLIVKGGSLVFEEYFDGQDIPLQTGNLLLGDTLNLEWKHFDRDEFHHCASVAKSVTSQLVGIAVDRGYLSGTGASMISFFPDYARFRSPEKDRITVDHMLTMTSGLPFDEQSSPIADPGNDARRLFYSEDPIAFMLARAVVHAPGTTYQYNSGTTVLLGEIVRRASGMSLPSFAREHLFGPLEISGFEWARIPRAQGVTMAAGMLYLRPRDMAKIGQLMLEEGVWNGRRVVSSEWVRRSVTQAIGMRGEGHARGYGYQWKLGRYGGFDAFWAAGWGGQYVVVIPDLELVFVQTAGRYQGENIPLAYDEIIEAYILPAVRER